MQASLVEAADIDADEPARRINLLHFRVLDTALCIPLARVVKVLALMQTDPVPGAVRHLRGLMRLQGEAVPLVDLAAWLRVADTTPYDVDAPVLLCRDGGRHVALLIDAVEGVAPDQALDEVVTGDVLARGCAFRTAVVHGDGLSMLLDLEQVLETL